MSTIQKASLALVLLAAVGVVPLSDAQAASSILGATVCVRANLVGNSSSGLEYTSEGLANVSSVQADVVCTLFRDNVSNTNGMQALQVSITDPSSGPGGFGCDALSLDRYGNQKIVKHQKNSVVGDSVLNWGSTVNVSASKGFYVLTCSMPPGAKLHSIYYVEP